VLQNIIDSNNSVREALEKGLDAVKLQENWDYLQINCAMYINSDMPGVASQSQPNTKPLRQAQVLTITLAFSVCAFFAGLLRSDQRHRRCHISVCLLPPCSVASAQSTFKTLSIENLSLRKIRGHIWDDAFIEIRLSYLSKQVPCRGFVYNVFWEIVCIGTLDGVQMLFA